MNKEICFVQTDEGSGILDIVSSRTKMPADILLKDTQEYHVSNLMDAVELFKQHAKNRSNIRVYGDYDADGIMCGCIMDMLSKILRLDMTITIPRRFSDGYGVSASNVSNMNGGLLITVDNGIAAIDAVSAAKNNNVDVIILDHHQPKKNEDGSLNLPEADVIVDPHVTGGDYKDYCGAGLAYLFADAVLSDPDFHIGKKLKNYAVSCMVSYAAIATVADAVPMTWHNRRIVKNGLWCMERGFCSTGLKALLEKYDLYGYITSMDLGFKIGPAINAYGRLEDKGSRKVKQFLSYTGRDIGYARKNANFLKFKNDERKQLSRICTERAWDLIKAGGQENNNFVVIYDDQCQAGIAGIVAGQISEALNTPCIELVNTDDKSVIKGSGRSPKGIHLEQLLKDADQKDQFMPRFGGHPGACGLSVYKNKLQEFTDYLNEITPKLESDDDGILYYDLPLSLDESEIQQTLTDLDLAGPYGQDNPEIVFLAEDVELTPRENGYASYMGDIGQHVRLSSKTIEFAWFDGAKEYRELGEPHKFSAIGTLSRHIWNGVVTPQFQIIAMIPLACNTDKKISFAEKLSALSTR